MIGVGQCESRPLRRHIALLDLPMCALLSASVGAIQRHGNPGAVWGLTMSALNGYRTTITSRAPTYTQEYVMRQFIRDEEGQDVVEYGLLIATIAIVVLLATAAFGANIGLWF